MFGACGCSVQARTEHEEENELAAKGRAALPGSAFQELAQLATLLRLCESRQDIVCKLRASELGWDVKHALAQRSAGVEAAGNVNRGFVGDQMAHDRIGSSPPSSLRPRAPLLFP